jgi:RHS repeat-associated protein
VLDNNNTALYAVSFYDKYGRVIQSVSQNHLGGWDRVTNEYDFVGNIILSKMEHKVPSDNLIETWQRFTYDHGNRLTKTEHRIGDDPLDWIIMSEMQYNEIGEMVQKNIHSQDNGSSYWQSVDYKYNIRGWLTNINSGFLSDDNMIIAHDENLEGLEMVIGLTIDTIHYELEYIEDKRGPNDKIKVEISDNKTIESELVIPGTINEGEANESEVLYLYAIGDDDGEDYTTMLPLDGYSFLFDLNQLHINSSSSVHDVLLAIDTKIIAELDNQNVDDVDQLEIVRNHVAVFVLNTLGISYLNEDGDDLFGMDLLYNNPPSSLGAASQYNGNISGIKWQSVNDEKAKCYGYNYDKLNRLKEAQYGEWASSGTWSHNADRYTVENFQYDLNGNILSLKRYGLNMFNGTDMGYGAVDDLTYSYTGNGNQLTAVEDVVSDMSFHSNDFSDGSSTGNGEYTYDVNGNMISDANKGISVTYNHMNLPTEIDFGNNNKITYLYLANGTKLKKTVEYTSANSDTKDYVGSFNYVDGVIECVLTSDGKLSPDAGASNGFRYEYYHKDHLGNIRMTFSDLNGNGSIEDDTEVLQENHYYPFGMEMMGLETPQIGAEDEYKYNGKELQVEHGLNWYDYGARFYDPNIIRFHSIDPLAETYNYQTPYSYAINNPILFIDKNGEGPGNPLEEIGNLCAKIENKIQSAVNSMSRAVSEAVVNIVDVAEQVSDVIIEGADNITDEQSTSPIGNAADAVETIEMVLDNKPIKDAAGQIGNAADFISIAKDAATTDFSDNDETADFVENTVQTTVEAAAGPLGSAINLIIEDSKRPNGVTNTENLNRNFQSNYRSSAAYVYKNFTLKRQQAAEKKKQEE